MITEDYVSFEVAKLLKDKGFHEPCRSYYIGSSGRYSRCAVEIRTINCASDEILRPTHQIAMKWLRKVHNIEIDTQRFPSTREEIGYYSYIHYSNFTKKAVIERKTYEEAVEAAIKYTLENLI